MCRIIKFIESEGRLISGHHGVWDHFNNKTYEQKKELVRGGEEMQDSLCTPEVAKMPTS